MTAIPLIFLTGFLGSGKTSLLNALLRDPAFVGTAVLINELGEVAIDHDLVAQVDDGILTTTTGCLCCTASSDAKQALFDLWNQRRQRVVPAFNRVIIEATGLADPVPVIASLLTPPGGQLIDNVIAAQFALAHVAATVDVISGDANLERHLEAVKQVALADLLVLTKTDIASDPASRRETGRLAASLADINPGADILDRHDDWPAIRDHLLAPSTYDLRTKGEDAVAWLAAERVAGHAHDHTAPPDPNRHPGGITSHCIIVEEPIRPLAFSFFLEALRMSAGPDLLRVKGLFNLADEPGRPVVVHGVQHVLHEIDRLPEWPSADVRTRIVLIGRNLNIDAMREIISKPRAAGAAPPGRL